MKKQVAEEHKVLSILYKYLRSQYPDLFPKDRILGSTPIRQLLDSVSMLDFLCFLEEEFDITVDVDEVVQSNFKNLMTISSWVRRKQGIGEVQP